MAQDVVVLLPGDGLEWAAATRAVAGSRVVSRVEGAHLIDGRYQVTARVRATGFPASALDDVVRSLRRRYGDSAVDVLQAGGPDGALLRTRLEVEALPSPYLRFLLRFHGDFEAVAVCIEDGRLQVRGRARAQADVEQDRKRIESFLRKLGGPAEVRVEQASDLTLPG